MRRQGHIHHVGCGLNHQVITLISVVSFGQSTCRYLAPGPWILTGVALIQAPRSAREHLGMVSGIDNQSVDGQLVETASLVDPATRHRRSTGGGAIGPGQE